MKKGLEVLGIIIITLVITMGFSGCKNNRQEVKKDNQQEAVNSKQQVIKQDNENQNQGEERAEESQASKKVEDTKNIKPKFGIDDSGLKYNKDGSVDTSDWKTFEHLNDKYLLPPGWSVVGTNGPNGSMEITNLSNIEAFKTELGIDVNIDGKVNIGIAGAPVDFGGTYEIDARVKKLLKENVDILLKEAAEQELQNPLFSRCNNGMTRRGEPCEELTKPKCTYDEKKKGKYMIVGCIYNRKETDEDMYILNKTIFFANKSGITEYSVYTETKERELIDKNRNIHSIIMDQVIENIVR